MRTGSIEQIGPRVENVRSGHGPQADCCSVCTNPVRCLHSAHRRLLAANGGTEKRRSRDQSRTGCEGVAPPTSGPASSSSLLSFSRRETVFGQQSGSNQIPLRPSVFVSCTGGAWACCAPHSHHESSLSEAGQGSQLGTGSQTRKLKRTLLTLALCIPPATSCNTERLDGWVPALRAPKQLSRTAVNEVQATPRCNVARQRGAHWPYQRSCRLRLWSNLGFAAPKLR